MGGSAKQSGSGRCTGDFSSVIFSVRCNLQKTSSSPSPVVRTPGANSRGQNGIETHEAWILPNKQFNRSEWIYERSLKYFLLSNHSAVKRKQNNF